MSLAAVYEFVLAALPGDDAQSQHVACRGRIYSLVPTYTWTIHTDTDHTNAELVYHVHSDHPAHLSNPLIPSTLQRTKHATSPLPTPRR
ncbi:hypothetical protein BKA82DRAFT_1006398 [Pisolithus tinctorius]|uniref:Uncharacterized protein n=1 Tax=Pisolithus tinctorius Marx 270 TaxID=870435 RepID=A0A0C3N779_PISTI|nr:hypothetical protein BKA82DRAFT_1006398 [Pisolithus tinctorius]KIN96899.1 hypothetical protein M404DRAFT_1006398 [Pisolithus tinctorius Marx 270]